MTERWDNLLKEMRQAVNSLCVSPESSHDATQVTLASSSPCSSSVLFLLESHLSEISHLLLDYIILMSTAASTTSASNSSSSSPPPASQKAIASNVYCALRVVMVALCCPNRTTRGQVQLLLTRTPTNSKGTKEPPVFLYMSLCNLISHNRIHLKNRNLAAKILCNIGTCHKQSAGVLLRDIPPCPTEEEVRRQIMLEKLSGCQIDEDDDNDIIKNDDDIVFNPTNEVMMNTTSTSWSQMIHTCDRCGDRDSLAVIVAALYNAMCSCMQKDSLSHHDGDENDHADADADTDADADDDDDVKLIKSVYICDKLLLSNLIRYILPCQVIEPAPKLGTTTITAAEPVPAAVKNEEQRDLSDDATEWISRWFEKFSSMGFLPIMYTALGGGGSGNGGGILPEQLVLLHCIGSCVKEYDERITHTSNRTEDMVHPLGEHVESMKKSCLFLTRLYCNLRQRLKFDESMEERYDGEISCIENGSNVILDILSSCLSISSVDEEPRHQQQHQQHQPFVNDGNALRRELGESTNIMQILVWDLGMIVDRLDHENRGINARELKIKESDQHHLISLVRLIANLSYKCRLHQDLVRTTNVPLLNSTTATTTTAVVAPNGHESTYNHVSSNRNGLHVLLSCTSFAYGCFTLREWAIIAIRNVLEDNEDNQKQVEQLDAQQALNTPELEKLGVKVHLDRKGHVHVTPKEGS